MKDFLIMTDSSADLPKSYLHEHDIYCVSLKYTLDGVTYDNDDEKAAKDFYKKLRDKSMPTTSQINPEEAADRLRDVLKRCKNILVIAFSSGLSGTCNSFKIAAQEVMEEDSEAKIYVIDSLSASLGQGLLVHKAVCMKESGADIETIVKWVEEHKLNIVHAFTVDDLNHLYRGGRLSKTAAVVGTMINLKPVLHVDDEGKLTNMYNVRGRKKSLHALVDHMEKTMGRYREDNDVIFISHGDNIDDAKFVADEVKKRFGISNVLFNPIGPTIGAHAGPDTIALFFMGENR
ncbi:MAG: DegV family protein [Lachnospiraceae bacterium]|nr:DegV family protein [Lachnospiraceae bacterium]